jgi:hypothetical protein
VWKDFSLERLRKRITQPEAPTQGDEIAEPEDGRSGDDV